MSLSRILTDFKGHFSYLKFCKIACFKNIACILSGCAYFQAVILLHKLYVYFYGAMLCIRGTSHGPVSVCVCLCLCLSVTSRSSTKTAKRRITQTTPNDSLGTLVF